MIRALGFSLWIILVTVIPGLITIASVVGAMWIFVPDAVNNVALLDNQWLVLAFVAAIMLVTQAVGIGLESQLIGRRLLGDTSVTIPEEVAGEPTEVNPYDEYDLLYFTLVSMGPDEDPNGHVERAVAQFFLSNNALVAFGTGLVTTVALASWSYATGSLTSRVVALTGGYLLCLALFLLAVYYITRIRFRVMTMAIWLLRDRPSAT